MQHTKTTQLPRDLHRNQTSKVYIRPTSRQLEHKFSVQILSFPSPLPKTPLPNLTTLYAQNRYANHPHRDPPLSQSRDPSVSKAGARGKPKPTGSIHKRPWRGTMGLYLSITTCWPHRIGTTFRMCSELSVLVQQAKRYENVAFNTSSPSLLSTRSKRSPNVAGRREVAWSSGAAVTRIYSSRGIEFWWRAGCGSRWGRRFVWACLGQRRWGQ